MRRALPAPHGDVALLVARVLLGVVLFAHGWQKLLVDGIARTSDQFDALGIPLAIVSASFVTVVEFVGGALLLVGAFTPVVVLLHLVVMIGAAGFVHLSNGLLSEDRGLELVTVIAACELVLAVAGAGRYSVDDVLHRRSRTGPGVTDPAGTTTRRLLTQPAAPAARRPDPPAQQGPATRRGPADRPGQEALFAPTGPQSRVEPRPTRRAQWTEPVPFVPPQPAQPAQPAQPVTARPPARAGEPGSPRSDR